MKSKNSSDNIQEKDITQVIPDNLPNWSKKELEAFKPKIKQKVSYWADENIVLDNSNSIPGPWRTDRTPYLRKPLDCFGDKKIRQINLCCGSQLGKTMVIYITMCYSMSQDPGAGMLVYPSEDDAKQVSEFRIQPFIKDSKISDMFLEKKSKQLELRFTTGYIRLVGAHAPNKLASFPAKNVWMDEVGKLPSFTGKEADPISLAKERTKTFPNDSKIVLASTPVLATGPMWTALMNSDVILQYHVPCPHCGEYQTFDFKQIKWPDELKKIDSKLASKLVVNLAKYHCKHCDKIIEDHQKQEMLLKGEWKPVNWDKEKGWLPSEWPEYIVKEIGFHINSIYSPFVTFGRVAEEFFKSKDSIDKLQNFINSWLGEPWKDQSNAMESKIILSKRQDYSSGTVPNDALILTGGIDVQQDHFWYVIRAWGEKLTSWLVDYGRVETWPELEDIFLNRRYLSEDGKKKYIVFKTCIDSGYKPEDVYLYCTLHNELWVPSKGEDHLNSFYTVSNLENSKYKKKFPHLKMYRINTFYFKSFINSRMDIDPGTPGSFNLFKDCPEEYADHLASEVKVTKKLKDGTEVSTWEKISTHAPNHLLDCEVNAACAAEIIRIRTMSVQNHTNRATKGRRVLGKGVR